MQRGEEAPLRGVVIRSPDLRGAPVAVKPRKDQVDTEIAEKRCAETNDRQQCRLLSFPSLGNPCVEIGGVDEPDDKRPCLLGVPAPVSSPCHIRPEGAGDDADRQQREADGDGFITDFVEQISPGQLIQ